VETQALAPQHIHIHQHPFPFNKQNKSKAAGDDLGQNDDDTAAPRRQELHTPLKTERKGGVPYSHNTGRLLRLVGQHGETNPNCTVGTRTPSPAEKTRSTSLPRPRGPTEAKRIDALAGEETGFGTAALSASQYCRRGKKQRLVEQIGLGLEPKDCGLAFG